MNNTNNNKKTPRLPPTDTVQPHQPLLYGSVSPQRPLAAAPPARVAPPTDTQTSVLLGRVDTFVPQRPGMVAVTSSPPQPASFVDSAAAAATAAAASNAQYSSSLSSSSSSGLAPPPPPHGRPRSPSDISSMVSNKPPTDTFSMPFPNGYYRVEFPVKLPSVFPDLLPNPLRYTAASSGFQDFANSTPVNRKPYTLRQQEAKHRTKMMVVITMYNEDVDLFSLTLG